MLSTLAACGGILTLSNPIFLPTAHSPVLTYLHPSSLPFSYKHNVANTRHNHLFTSEKQEERNLRYLLAKSILHEEKRRAGFDSGAEQENRNVGRGLT